MREERDRESAERTAAHCRQDEPGRGIRNEARAATTHRHEPTHHERPESAGPTGSTAGPEVARLAACTYL